MDATILGGLGLAAALTSSMAPTILMRPVRDRLTRHAPATPAPQWVGHGECLGIRSAGECLGLPRRARPEAVEPTFVFTPDEVLARVFPDHDALVAEVEAELRRSAS